MEKVCDHIIKACIKMHMPKINQLSLHEQAYFWHALTFAYDFKMFSLMFFIHVCSIKIYAHLLMNTISIGDKKIGKIEKTWSLCWKRVSMEKNEVDAEKGKIRKDVLVSAWEVCRRTWKDFNSPSYKCFIFQLKSALKVMVFKSTSENEMWNSHWFHQL